MTTDPITRLNAALEGRYRIERELGEGGMATVYLADDLKHERKVALKVLKPELAAAVGAERFLAEIKTTANLQHPHILPLFDSGDADGFLFYTMPYVEGETLRTRMEREAVLEVEEAIRITADVAEALQVAHERGIVHRDIKPSNILLNRGNALVADFGIAGAVALAGEERLTQTGSSMGTIGYMSPEQSSGEGAIDPRADVYSLGCVLFEMLGGRLPYVGPSVMSVLVQQATEPVPSLRALRPEIPAGLDDVVTTALAREPADRFASTAALAAALTGARAKRTSGTVTGGSDKRLILVMPFTNLSRDPGDEYFSDGLTDEVITDLAGVSALATISRSSAMALKGTTKPPSDLARELGITHLVTGTVRRVGDALRVASDLVEAGTDRTIWSQKFSGTMEDVFGIQEEISRQIVAALKVKLTEAEDRGVAEHLIDDPVAYDCYRRACHLMYNWTPEGQERALQLVDEALGITGESALLLAMKGHLHWNLVNMNMAPRDEALTRASEFVDRALRLDPGSSSAVFVRGLIGGMRGQAETALVDLYRARELRPGDFNVLVELIRFSHGAGLRDYWKYIDQAVQSDPFTPQASLHKAMYLCLKGPAAEAAPHARKALELAPDVSMLYLTVSWTLAHAGASEESADALARVVAAKGDDVIGRLAALMRSGFTRDERGIDGLDMGQLEQDVRNEFLCLMAAEACALLGRTNDALRWLRAAIDGGFIDYANLSGVNPFLESLHGEPRFQELMDEIRPRWESVVAWEQGLKA
ncbi:MAG: protein kinase [Gemmatimonadota bacterium]|nr:protein kinase [Gemmatimonadota bacterium]